jgi:hypothetical protein
MMQARPAASIPSARDERAAELHLSDSAEAGVVQHGWRIHGAKRLHP